MSTLYLILVSASLVCGAAAAALLWFDARNRARRATAELLSALRQSDAAVFEDLQEIAERTEDLLGRVSVSHKPDGALFVEIADLRTRLLSLRRVLEAATASEVALQAAGIPFDRVLHGLENACAALQDLDVLAKASAGEEFSSALHTAARCGATRAGELAVEVRAVRAGIQRQEAELVTKAA